MALPRDCLELLQEARLSKRTNIARPNNFLIPEVYWEGTQKAQTKPKKQKTDFLVPFCGIYCAFCVSFRLQEQLIECFAGIGRRGWNVLDAKADRLNVYDGC